MTSNKTDRVDSSPGWFRRAVIYHILVDRFAGFTPENALDWDKPVFVGGNLRGIRERLDYLVDLGITAIWLSPFYQTVDYHGYHITDFRAVDEHFGRLADFAELVAECRKRGLRIIADLVPNHCHERHPIFQDARTSSESPYRNWFFFDANGNYQSFLGCGWLPKLNLENPEARAYMIKCALFWLDQGMDGFRIDHAIGMSHGFFKALSAACKEKKPESVLFGEAIIDRPALRRYRDTLVMNHKWWRAMFGFRQDALQKDYCGVLDGVLDFSFRRLAVRFAEGRLGEPDFRRALDMHFERYPPDFALVLFLDSHDDDRLLCRARGDRDRIQHAVRILLDVARRYRHPVSFYYGFEVLLHQVVPIPPGYPHGDLLPRRVMDWRTDKPAADFRDFLSQEIEAHKRAMS